MPLNVLHTIAVTFAVTSLNNANKLSTHTHTKKATNQIKFPLVLSVFPGIDDVFEVTNEYSTIDLHWSFLLLHPVNDLRVVYGRTTSAIAAAGLFLERSSLRLLMRRKAKIMHAVGEERNEVRGLRLSV